MKLPWRSGKNMNYESFRIVESKRQPGVSFEIHRMSFARRVELTRRIREIAQRFEYLDSRTDPRDRIEAAWLAAEIDNLYLTWGLGGISGLNLDGEPATPERLAAIGPEELCREALDAIKAECGLSEAERKN